MSAVARNNNDIDISSPEDSLSLLNRNSCHSCLESSKFRGNFSKFCHMMDRQTVVRLRTLFLLIVLSPSAWSFGQVAYVQGSNLYVADYSIRGLKNVRTVTRLWPKTRDESVHVRWAPDGRIAILHGVNSYDRRHFGMSLGTETTGLWMVSPLASQDPKWLLQGQDIAFSPDGKTVAYSTDDFAGDTWLYDLQSGSRRLAFKMATNLIWSQDGKKVALIRIRDRKSFSQSVEVHRYPGLELMRKLSEAVNPCDLQFSPNGKQIAIHYHLSRPLTGHSILDLDSGNDVPHIQPERFAPAVITDWSPDGKMTASDWRTMDPENDGSWTDCRIGISQIGGSSCLSLGLGHEAIFSPDSKCVLFQTDHRTGCSWHRNDLVIQSVKGGKVTTLARNVSAFAVWRPLMATKSNVLKP